MKIAALGRLVGLLSIVGVCSAAPAQLTDPDTTPSSPRTTPDVPDHAAHMVLEPETWHFGEVWLGSRPTCEVAVRNDGGGPLRIIAVFPTDESVTAEVDKQHLEPGETTTLRITYNTMRGQPSVREGLRIFTNDPRDHGFRPFVLRGKCRALYEVAEPHNSLRFTGLRTDDRVTETFILENKHDEKVRLALGDEPVENIKAELKELEAGRRYALRLTTVPPLPDELTTRTLTLKTDLPDLPDLPMNVVLVAVPPIEARPEALIVSARLQLPTTRPLEILFADERPVRIERIECADPAVSWEFVTPPDGAVRAGRRYHRLQVTLPAGSALPEEGLSLEVTTNLKDAAHARLAVPIKRYEAESAEAASGPTGRRR